MSIAVYTATTGEYPIIREDIQCFGEDGIFAKPVMEAKRYKILSHLFFDDEITIWTDANIALRWPAAETVEFFLGDADMALFKHPFRETPWQEFSALREQKRFRLPWLQKQLQDQEEAYFKAGLPSDTPLYECSFLIRRNNERVNRLMEAWWAQICRWQWRDQVSLPYCLWKNPVRLAVHALNAREHPAFHYESMY
jgi:hypothetical protein